jgi:hypothetical protein
LKNNQSNNYIASSVLSNSSNAYSKSHNEHEISPPKNFLKMVESNRGKETDSDLQKRLDKLNDSNKQRKYELLTIVDFDCSFIRFRLKDKSIPNEIELQQRLDKLKGKNVSLFPIKHENDCPK